MDVTLSTFTTRKGTVGLTVNNYKFRKDKTRAQRITWRCCNKMCKSRCSTDIATSQLIIPPTEHNHEEVEDRVFEMDKVRAACKRKATEDINTRASKIVCTESEQHPSISMNDLHNLSMSVYRERMKSRPRLPKSRQEVFTALKDYHLGNNLSIFVNDPENEIIMISSHENLRHLQSVTDIYADGTFKYSPKFFYQLFTIHAFKDNVYAPCAFFLLPDKREKTYHQMFKHLHTVCTEHETSLNFTSIHLDLEISIHQAVKRIWPDVEIKACAFHVAQAWYRHIQHLGLIPEYRNKDSVIGNWLKLFFALPALPATEVEDCFSFVLFASAPNNERCIEFSDYILLNYLNTSKFPPHLWAHGGEDARTTNACESFHRYFGEHFTSPSPNVFTFMDALQEEQRRTALKIRTARSTVTKRKAQRDKEDKRNEILIKYKKQEISQTQFLSQMYTIMLPLTTL